MGIKSRGNYSTGLKECTPNCICIFCKRKQQEKEQADDKRSRIKD